MNIALHLYSWTERREAKKVVFSSAISTVLYRNSTARFKIWEFQLVDF